MNKIYMKFCIIETQFVNLFASEEDDFINSLPIIKKTFINNEEINIRNGRHYAHFNFFKNIIEKIHSNKTIFIDVGAYIGSISLTLFSYLNNSVKQQSEFYLFEPNPINFNCIQKSLKHNDIKNIKLFNEAVSNKNETLNFLHNEKKAVAGRICYEDSPTKVKATTIDEKFKIDNQNIIIKVDTEGHEPKVLQGMQNLLNKNNCILILEIHPYCLGEKINEKYDMFNFINEKFDLFVTPNICCPKNFTKVNNLKEMEASIERNGQKVADVVCFPKKLNIDVTNYIGGE